MKRTIGISCIDYDPFGARTLYLSSESRESINQGGRRVTRTKTLDGAAVVYDAGYAVADLTWLLTVEAKSVTVGAYLAMLVKTYNEVRICTDDGVFLAVPSRWRESQGKATLEALIIEKET
jgi:hypothetical protein